MLRILKEKNLKSIISAKSVHINKTFNQLTITIFFRFIYE